MKRVETELELYDEMVKMSMQSRDYLSCMLWLHERIGDIYFIILLSTGQRSSVYLFLSTLIIRSRPAQSRFQAYSLQVSAPVH